MHIPLVSKDAIKSSFFEIPRIMNVYYEVRLIHTSGMVMQQNRKSHPQVWK